MRLALTLGAAALVSAAAIAQAPTRASGTRLIDIAKGDPNDIVCVQFTVTGSRLARQRVCRTRAEWVDLHRQTRGVVEKVQFYKPTFAN